VEAVLVVILDHTFGGLTCYFIYLYGLVIGEHEGFKPTCLFFLLQLIAGKAGKVCAWSLSCLALALSSNDECKAYGGSQLSVLVT